MFNSLQIKKLLVKASEFGQNTEWVLNTRKDFLKDTFAYYKQAWRQCTIEEDKQVICEIAFKLKKEIDEINFALNGKYRVLVLEEKLRPIKKYKHDLEVRKNAYSKDNINTKFTQSILQDLNKQITRIQSQIDFAKQYQVKIDELKAKKNNFANLSVFQKEMLKNEGIDIPDEKNIEKKQEQNKEDIEKEIKALQRENLDVKLDKAKRADIHQVLSMFGLKTDQGKKIKSIYKTDQTPSMHIYSNCEFHNFYDYSTGKSGDVIKLYQDLAGVDFITAVNTLSNM